MYNTHFICTYNTPEVFLESDILSDDEKKFVRDVIYRQELLNILGMENFNDSEMEREMERIIHELFKKVSENLFLKECMIKLSERFLNIDQEIGLMLMFSFDYMYLTHICISELLDTGIISDKNMSNLRSIIF
jgi:hypothetical protein